MNHFPPRTSESSFDPTDPDEPTATIVEEIAALEGVSPFEIPSLYTWVDTGALNQLTDGRHSLRISLTIADHTVEVDTCGSVTIKSDWNAGTAGVTAE